jgi:hypothetical protein
LKTIDRLAYGARFSLRQDDAEVAPSPKMRNSDVFPNRMRDKQPFGAPICRKINDPGPNGLTGGIKMNGSAIQPNFASRRQESEKRTHNFPLSITLDPSKSYDLTGSNRERDVIKISGTR